MEIQDETSKTFLEKSNKYDESNSKMFSDNTKFFLRKRYLVVILAFLGWSTLFLLRTNLSISLVAMTSNTSVTIANKTYIIPPEFNWTPVEKGLILSSFSWGLFATPIGAWLAIRIGGTTVFGAGIAATGLLTLSTPLLIQWNLSIYLLVRILEGVAEGFSVPAFTNIFTYWAPPSERSRLFSYAYLGSVVGTVISYPICGTIAFYLEWRAIFYITGGAAIVWYVIWLALVTKSPKTDKLISQTERKYLCHVNRHFCHESVKVYPWKQILKSKAVWAFVNDRFVEGWSMSFVTYCLPLYMKDCYNSNIQNIGFLSGVPHICAVIGLVGGSIVADYLRTRQLLSVTNVHRIYLTFGQTAAVILLMTIALWRNFLVGVIGLSLFRLLFIICEVSYQVLPVDIGGQYGSFIMSLSGVGCSIAYALNPIAMEFFVENHSVAGWSQYFLFLSAFNLWGGIVFYFFGSGDLQPWAVNQNSNEHEPPNEKFWLETQEMPLNTF